jgi:hypothetical protein
MWTNTRPMMRRALCALLLLGCLVPWAVAIAKREVPETVMVTYHVRLGQKAALARVLARHWATARRLNLVRGAPHIIVQGAGSGDPYFVEIFTWRDGSIPDSAPAEIKGLWSEMGRLVEPRNGRPGIDFQQVSLLSP